MGLQTRPFGIGEVGWIRSSHACQSTVTDTGPPLFRQSLEGALCEVRRGEGLGTKSRSPAEDAPYARGRTRLRLGGGVQDPADSVYHHLRPIPLDEVPAALYNAVDTIGREVG